MNHHVLKTIAFTVILFTAQCTSTTFAAPPMFLFDECVSGNCFTGRGKMVSSNGNVYEGDFVGGVKEGNGTFTTTTGQVYVGQFSKDKFHGKGKITFPSGDTYDGDWVENARTGKARATYVNGEAYLGSWVNGLREGEGTYVYKDGSYYVGEWKNNKQNGAGKFSSKATNKLTDGVWKDGNFVSSAAVVRTPPKGNCVSRNCKNGLGKIVYDTGDSYEGTFLNGFANGKGKETHTDGSFYVGDFVNGQFEGRGTYTYKGGIVYTGQFTNSVYNGKGKIQFPDGNSYDGDWVNGKYEGQGTYSFKNGSYYTGGWKDGKQNGFGKQFNKLTNVVSEGTWKDDYLVGPAIRTPSSPNSNCLSGDCKNGFGKFVFTNGDVYEGNYVNGKYEGKGTYTSKNGNYYSGEWKNGKQNGIGKQFIKATNASQEGTWKDGVLVTPAKPNTAATNPSVGPTVALLRDTLNGKFEYMEKKPLVYRVTKKASRENSLYQIEFINDGNKLAFKWKETIKNEQSEKLVITDTAIATANKYVNFFTTKSAVLTDSEITFILSQTLYKELKAKNAVSLDLGKGPQKFTFNYNLSAPFGVYTEKKVKILYLQSTDGTVKVKVLDDPILPLILSIDTPEYSLDLVKSS